jgi:ribosome-binding ATPase YchF (GTP1/OBG family)
VIANYYSLLESKPICLNNKIGGENEQMSEESVKNNINEIEKILNASSHQYVTISAGAKSILQFLPEKGISEEVKTYGDQQVKKIRFIVIEPSSGSNSERFFDIGKRSARLMIEKIKAGHRTLKVERIGAGKDTLYIPTEIT